MRNCLVTDIHRFWSYVQKKGPNDCWPWRRATNGKYGRFALRKNELYYAHRFTYYLEYGIDPDILYVCHHCDNPLCCNPRHLFLGTQYDNLQDASKKGRLGRNMQGEKNGNVKLTEEKVKEIRYFLKIGIMQIIIAEMFNVTPTTILNIKKGILWKHLETV